MNHDKFDYFIERTEADLSEIKVKLDQLWSFRLMLLGAAMTISVLFSCATTFFILLFKH